MENFAKDPKIINGKDLALRREEKLKIKVAQLGIIPKVVSILIGDDPPSVLYTHIKQKKAAELGINFEPIKLGTDTDFYKVMLLIIAQNEDPLVHGIMVQLPLPQEFLGSHKSFEILELIKKEKDVDGLTQNSLFLTAAVEAVKDIIEEEQIEVSGKYCVVVGSSDLIGKPIGSELEKLGGMVKLTDSRTQDLQTYTKRADILVSATGVPHLIKGHMVKEGVVVIDVGVMVIEEEDEEKGSRVKGKEISKGRKIKFRDDKGTYDLNNSKKVLGDVEFDSVYPKASKITPVPGGVGPITVVALMENVVKSALKAK